MTALAVAAAIQAQVNADTRYRSDPDLYGRPEFWAVADGASGCEDYALAYRQKLLAAGADPGSLRLALARTEEGAQHAVLLVTTDDGGTVVLDCRYPEPRHRWQLGYDWIAMQEGKTWRAIV